MNDNDNEEMNRSVKLFQNIINSNLTTTISPYKLGATFIGIKTNISGTLKLHKYILLFPFIDNYEISPYPNIYPNVFMKDIWINVDDVFYLWMYEEMRKQQSIIIMSFVDYQIKVVPSCGDLLINIDVVCNEPKDFMKLEFKEWYEKHTFNNIFTIKIINPYLYMVPFPLKNILVKTERTLHNYMVLKT
jgi:hypothetical protein